MKNAIYMLSLLNAKIIFFSFTSGCKKDYLEIIDGNNLKGDDSQVKVPTFTTTFHEIISKFLSLCTYSFMKSIHICNKKGKIIFSVIFLLDFCLVKSSVLWVFI